MDFGAQGDEVRNHSTIHPNGPAARSGHGAENVGSRCGPSRPCGRAAALPSPASSRARSDRPIEHRQRRRCRGSRGGTPLASTCLRPCPPEFDVAASLGPTAARGGCSATSRAGAEPCANPARRDAEERSCTGASQGCKGRHAPCLNMPEAMSTTAVAPLGPTARDGRSATRPSRSRLRRRPRPAQHDAEERWFTGALQGFKGRHAPCLLHVFY